MSDGRAPGTTRLPAGAGEPVLSPAGAQELFEEVSAKLGSAREARWILEHAAGPDGLHLRSLTDSDRPLTSRQVAEVELMVERRRAGEPLQYVLGTWAFRRLEVHVDLRVLIPRPETELVVGYALEEHARIASAVGPGEPFVAVDLGTGSGVIALSLAAECARSVRALAAEGAQSVPRPFEVWATDDSAEALAVARANLAELELLAPEAAASVQLSEGSWFGALPEELAGGVQLLVSNPPYVSAPEWESLDREVRDHEPRRALVAGETGLEVLELLVKEAPAWLAPGASVVLELAPHQAGAVQAMAQSAGLVEVEIRPDLAGRPRALGARRRGA